MRRLSIIAGAVLALGVLSSVAAVQYAAPPADARRAPAWREIAWPFPRDGWPAGRAFRCVSAACGGTAEIYVRPNLGFCNCGTGVADDDEVDRVADIDLISARFAPLAPGKVVRIAELSGRSRSYDLDMPGGARHAAVGIALSHSCDLLVAVAQGDGRPSELHRAALEFLASHEISHWMIAALEGH
jgi:hypothetical protein